MLWPCFKLVSKYGYERKGCGCNKQGIQVPIECVPHKCNLGLGFSNEQSKWKPWLNVDMISTQSHSLELIHPPLPTIFMSSCEQSSFSPQEKGLLPAPHSLSKQKCILLRLLKAHLITLPTTHKKSHKHDKEKNYLYAYH